MCVGGSSNISVLFIKKKGLGTLCVCVCPCVCMHAHVLGRVYLGVKLGFLDSSVTDLSPCFMLCWQHYKIPRKKMKSYVFFLSWSQASYSPNQVQVFILSVMI